MLKSSVKVFCLPIWNIKLKMYDVFENVKILKLILIDAKSLIRI